VLFVFIICCEYCNRLCSIFISVLFLFKYLQDGETREGASLSMVFVHKESSVTEGDAVGLDRDARSKIAFPISW